MQVDKLNKYLTAMRDPSLCLAKQNQCVSNDGKSVNYLNFQ